MSFGCRGSIRDSYWNFCGETDMGQTMPVLCKGCGGKYDLLTEEEILERKKKTKKYYADRKKWEEENPIEHKKQIQKCVEAFKESEERARKPMKASKITYRRRYFKDESAIICEDQVVDGKLKRTWYN